MTRDQLKMARAALGLPNDQRRSFRNRYFASIGTDAEERWNDLVSRGLAMREKGGGKLAHFYLTDRGAQMALDPVESLDPEDFPPVANGDGHHDS